MIEFSSTLKSKGLPTSVSSSADVDTLMDAFQDELRKLSLWQYYVLDVVKEKQAIKDALSGGDVSPWSGSNISSKSVVELAEIIRDFGIVTGLRSFEKRYAAHVDGSVAAGIVKAAFVDLGDDIDALSDAWIQVVDVLNVPLYQEWEEDTSAALEQMKGRLKYIRLEEHGPKLGPITEEYVEVQISATTILLIGHMQLTPR